MPSTYYIGTTGSNTNSGTIDKPFATFDGLTTALKASGGLQPGDTVYFLSGTYSNATFGDGNVWKDGQDIALKITGVNGTADAPITIAAAPGADVHIAYDGANGIRITNSSYVRIEGFDVGGPNQQITLQQALDYQWAYKLPNDPTVYYRDPSATLAQSIASLGGTQPNYFHSQGIAVGNAANHIEIVNNTVHDAPGYGISSLGGANDITVSGNTVYNNAWYGGGNHGISIQNAIDDGSGTVNIIGNTLHDNYSLLISWALAKTAPVSMVIDEGKGIHLQNDTAPVLVANNLVVRSGNAGITGNTASNVTIVNNTLVDNGYINALIAAGAADPQVAGQTVNDGGIRLQGGSGITVVNNLIVAPAGTYALDPSTGLTPTEVTVADNLVVGTPVVNNSAFAGGFTTIMDAEFVDAANGDYRLTSASPAINAGSNSVSSLIGTDITGAARTDGMIDVGAFEFSAGTAAMTTVTLNTNALHDDTLAVSSFAMPTSAFTIELELGLPANWEASGNAVTLVQYGSGSASSSGFAISTWSDYLDVYIAGRLFNTTIPISTLVGSTHRISITWDRTTGAAQSFVDGSLLDTATVAAGRTITSGQPLTLGAGGANELTPMASFGDVRVFDRVRTATEIANTSGTTLTGNEAGLVGYWTASGNQLASQIGGSDLGLVQQAITMVDRGQLALATPTHGTIAAAGSHDRYAVTLQAGQAYTFALVGTGATNLVDPYLRLTDAAGNVVASNNDAAPDRNAWFTYTPSAAGTYYLDAASATGLLTGDYGIVASTDSHPVFDASMGAGMLDNHRSWSAARGTGTTITYDFVTSNIDNVSNFTAFNAYQQTITREVLQLYSEATGLIFQEVDPSQGAAAGVSFYNYSAADGTGGHAGGSQGGHVSIAINRTPPSTFEDLGTYAATTILHEFGHALGLSHPGRYSAGVGVSISYDASAQFFQDSIQYTQMSYWSETNTGGLFGGGGYGDTPMLLDILALQQMYGANTTTRTGDTVYGFNCTADNAVYDFSVNAQPGVCIWDAGGNDTLDVSGFRQDQVVSLVSGNFSDVGGFLHNVSIAYGATVENAVGGGGRDKIEGNGADNALSGGDNADTLTGGLGADTLTGGRGNDSLEGGDGNDLLIGDGTNLIVDPAIYGLSLNSNGGSGQSISRANVSGLPQTAITIEFEIGYPAVPATTKWGVVSLPGLNIVADPTNSGAPGLWFYLNNTWTYSGISIASLTDRAHRVSFTWDSVTGNGAYYLDGTRVKSISAFSQGVSLGTGAGTVSVAPASAGIGDVRIYDRVLTAAEIDATAATLLTDPVNATGLVLDWQVGANGTVTDAHGGPAPTITNGTGTAPAVTTLVAATSFDDWLSGGIGDDTLRGGLGNDMLIGGAGSNTADWSDATGNDTLVLGAAGSGTFSDAATGTDTYSEIQNVRLGGGNDKIIGNAVANSLDGSAGNDTLTGGGGDDTLIGGIGSDLATYSGARGAYGVALDNATHICTVTDSRAGADGRDSLSGIERLQFSDNTVVTLDIDNVNTWLMTTTHYDSQNARDYVSFAYDDGTSAFTDYDQTSAYDWSSAVTQYDALGRTNYVSITKDDGRNITTSYDPSNQYSWSRAITGYDNLHRRMYVTTEMDNGTSAYTKYDYTASLPWTQATYYYDATGKLTTSTILYDDGSTVTHRVA